MIGIGRAAAGAVQPGPAVAAFLPRVDVAGGKLGLRGGVGHPLGHAAQAVPLLPHKLVAGVQIPPRGHGHILGARAAARDALVDTGPALQVDHIVVKGKGPALPAALPHQPGQLLVLLLDHRNVIVGQGGRVARRADHRLHAQLGKAEVQHGPDILEEVGVGVRKGTADVVVFAPAGLHQALEFRHHPVIAPPPGIVHAVAVVYLAPAVQAQHHVAHFAVGKLNHVIVNQHPVGGERKAEALAGRPLDAAGIGHQALDHIPIHQRLAAEKVHLQVAPRTRVRHQKIQRLPAHLKAHHGPLAVIFALAGKAVGAVEVAGVGDVQAERLDHAGGFALELAGGRLVGVGGEQPAGVAQGADLVIAFGNVGLADALAVLRALPRVPAGKLPQQLLPAVLLKHANQVVCQPVHQMDRARADVQHNVVPAKLITMNHFAFLSLTQSS